MQSPKRKPHVTRVVSINSLLEAKGREIMSRPPEPRFDTVHVFTDKPLGADALDILEHVKQLFELQVRLRTEMIGFIMHRGLFDEYEAYKERYRREAKERELQRAERERATAE